MAVVVKNNMSAVETLNTLNKNSGALAKSLKKVSSGMRITGAADDASGYAISERMKVQLRGLEQDNRNAQNGTSMLKVAEGAISSTVEILKTLKEKAINAANDTNTDQDRATIQKEVNQSLDQIDDNALVTFNGKYLVNGAMGGRISGSAQEVILSFMSSLDNTALSGTAALDEAINYASGGTFSTEADLVSRFISDLQGAGSGTAFLKDYCDIDLDNADTGAITGLDAGGEKEKTAESIVPESGSPYTGSVPTGSSTINGLTVNWPSSAEYASTPATQSAKEAIAKALNSQWMKNCLDLVNESYEMNFEESGATVNTINVKFTDVADNTLAYVTSHYTGDTTTALDLTVNMHYYAALDLSDENGSTSTPGAGYLDRTLAHEMTHAVMSANIKGFSQLPLYIKEGAAELVHGIDDFRRNTITNLVNDPSTMENVLKNSDSYTSDAKPYAAGYTLLRYFAKQGANSEPPKTVALQIGTKANQAIKFGLADMRSVSLGLKSTDGKTVSLVTQKKANAAINIFDRAIEKALNQQTSIGALQSRLEYTSSNLVVASENVQYAESTIRDADMAKEMTEYTKSNVLMQSAQSMLAQANQNSSSVLSLLQ